MYEDIIWEGFAISRAAYHALLQQHNIFQTE